MEAAMKIENRQQFLIVLTIAAFALLVGVDFVLTPLSHWWTSRQEQIRVLQTKVEEGRQILRREAGIRSRWDFMSTNALSANTSLAEQNVLQSVSDWARSSGVELASVMPQWKSDSTNYWNLACRVESAGNLGSLTKFLYDLEKGPMALRLDSVELNSRDNTGQQMTMGLEVNGLALLAPGKP
jgi:Tfp pilus assembly protein PilO